jgi:non-lysosomal glucosylceramidase
MGAGSAALLGSSAWGAFSLSDKDFESWKKTLLHPAAPHRYSSDRHTDARLHLGGIGTGNFEIGVDGQFTNWQLFNTLHDGNCPFHFAVKAGRVAKLLQTTGGPDWPRIKQIEMTGEYPVASLRFQDDELPVQLELVAYTPLVPLNTELSSLPLAVLKFRAHNPSDKPQEISIGAFVTNFIGYDALTPINGHAQVNFWGNFNEYFAEDGAVGVLLRARAGTAAQVDRPVTIVTLANLKGLAAPPRDFPEQMELRILENQDLTERMISKPEQTVLWLEEPSETLSAGFLRSALAAVKAGAMLAFSGKRMPLLEIAAVPSDLDHGAEPRPDIVFDNFENGYDRWNIEGEAFGKEPAHGRFGDQQAVSGYAGHGFVNSYLGGDDSTGKLTSNPFTIVRRFIKFLVGGGDYRNTQIRLLVDGKVVRATSGKRMELLEPAFWNVAEFAGRTAQIQIVDEQKGGWGHINIDQIVFSDAFLDPEVVSILNEMLPARFSAVRELPGTPGKPPAIVLENPVLIDGTQETRMATGLRVLSRKIGGGKVILVAGQLLEPAEARSSRPRQQAFETLCSLIGAQYVMADGQSPKAPGFGSAAIALLDHEPTGWLSFEDWASAWKQFSGAGSFSKLQPSQTSAPSAPGITTSAALATTFTLAAGASREVPFLMAWHFPNSYYHDDREKWIGTYYATRWNDARSVIRAAARNYAGWNGRTESFRETFYDSTLPYWLLDGMTANAGILRHVGVVFRIANGDIYGWEGSNGCCDPTCTHVWGYEQTLSRLFPDLEKAMRRLDFRHQQNSDGGINNRTDVPSPLHPTGEHPFADGHASCVLKAYREALNSPDESFFQEYWPQVDAAVNYLIKRDAKSAGGEPAGVLQDDQFNTYDEALHGVTTFISGYYLAALKAGEAWARRVGETQRAESLLAIFQKGQKKLVDLCWNGEYFQQRLDDYKSRKGEIGPGCMADQLIGQWWLHQLGLGYLLPKEMVVSALRSIFKYNFHSDLTGWKHSPRAFAGAKDKGLIICTWPKGGRPENVMLYSDEVWTGIEYQVAAHMIYEGLLEEGFAIVKGARERYDGIPRPPIPRNPWNEIECGGHYARAMSSWSLLLALSGFELDGPRGILRFQPRYQESRFKSFFSGPQSWGSLSQEMGLHGQEVRVAVREGTLKLRQLRLKLHAGSPPRLSSVTIGNKSLPATLGSSGSEIILEFGSEGVELNEGDELRVSLNLA